MAESPPTFQSISRSLGRNRPPATVPTPPAVVESITRLVAKDADLVAAFVQNATAAKLKVERCSLADAPNRLTHVLRDRQATRVMFTRSKVTEDLVGRAEFGSAGIEAIWWDESSLDAAYDVDAGVTDVWRAIAETGSLVVRSSPLHGRSVSLVPAVHVAVVSPRQIVADLIDVLSDMKQDEPTSGYVMITGPSKTADIEMNLVVGVHGPAEVIVLLLDDEPTA